MRASVGLFDRVERLGHLFDSGTFCSKGRFKLEMSERVSVGP